MFFKLGKTNIEIKVELETKICSFDTSPTGIKLIFNS